MPKSIIRILNNPKNRSLIKGVIAWGNQALGRSLQHCWHVVAEKCNVPLLYRFELSGTQTDVEIVRNRLKQFWETSWITTSRMSLYHALNAMLNLLIKGVDSV